MPKQEISDSEAGKLASTAIQNALLEIVLFEFETYYEGLDQMIFKNYVDVNDKSASDKLRKRISQKLEESLKEYRVKCAVSSE